MWHWVLAGLVVLGVGVITATTENRPPIEALLVIGIVSCLVLIEPVGRGQK